MPTIHALDSVTVTQIAAGEVIDRPSSVVKELVENSIDAGAKNIHITLKDGGKELIRITDDGHGIAKDDLPIAPLKHTTSKINQLDDIYQLHSFGFRGEALASICHVAEVEIASKTSSDSAWQMTAFQDNLSDLTPLSMPQGTRISAHRLFETLPVRKKFLKTKATELSHILDLVMHFAVIHPHLNFVVTSDDEERLNTTGISDLTDLMIHLYGKQLKDKLVDVDTSIGPITFKGLLSDPTYTVGSRKMMILSVNGRLLKSGLLQKAFLDSYRDIIPHRRFPVVVMDIQVDPHVVDVNIHPQKHDIKFIDPSFLFNAIPKLVRSTMQQHSAHYTALSQAVSEPPQATPTFPSNAVSFLDQSAVLFDTPHHTIPTVSDSLFTTQPSETQKTDYFQLFDTYIAIQTSQGLCVLDQHAVHERILYEEIKDHFNTEAHRQPLLISEVVELSGDLLSVFEEKRDYFKALNFVIDAFGPTQIVVREIPTAFANAAISELVISILEQLQAVPNAVSDLTLTQKETLQMKACKAAIKAGKKMYPEEVQKLVQDLVKCPSKFTCPHGRPLSIMLTKSELEKLFLRT